MTANTHPLAWTAIRSYGDLLTNEDRAAILDAPTAEAVGAILDRVDARTVPAEPTAVPTEAPGRPARPTETREDGVIVDGYDGRPVRPVQPRTPAQRRAVATLVDHGRVWVQGRGRWTVSGTNGAEVSGAMSVWLQANGWARWNYASGGLPTLVVLTRERGAYGVRPVSDGVHRCLTCGRRWNEETPAGRCPWEDVHPAE